MPASDGRRVRAVHIGSTDAVARHGADGVVYLTAAHPLGPYAKRMTDWLDEWAVRAPARPFLAQRGRTGDWRIVSYAQALQAARALGQALLDRRLGPDRPVVILSGNGIDHGLLALACMYVGVPYAPIAPAYALQARDFGSLAQVFERVRPSLTFAADGSAFAPALRSVLPPGVELVVSDSAPDGLPHTWFADLLATSPGPDVDAARDAVGPDTIAKLLFTSGSTGRPKGVINTQRMLCSNQEMIRAVLAFLGDAPPVLCDWLPWNHTAGGNHNFGLVLRNGGTLYIDEGRPTSQLFDVTLRNLREIAATAHFTVPRTYELLTPHLRRDRALRDTFFRDLKLLFYAAAGLGQRFWDELRQVAIDACGEELLIMTGFGATETAPFALSTGLGGAAAGVLGFPARGMELKLAPVGAKLEGRVRGPNITPGYWRDEALTRAAFDEEGFYRLGDAMCFVEPSDPAQGMVFDGRLAEDFKLSTGTWVSVGPLRSRLMAQAAGLAQDVVIAGPDREYPAALVVPNLQACRDIVGEGAPAMSTRDLLAHPRVRARVQEVIDALARQATGGSTFVARALLLEAPPSLDAREITDKGSLNQQVMLTNRAPLVEALYAAVPDARVIVCEAQPAFIEETGA
jgi:feruloyl-CoA synthase